MATLTEVVASWKGATVGTGGSGSNVGNTSGSHDNGEGGGGTGRGGENNPTYTPSPKHEPGHNWGSENPIKTQEEGQELLDTGYSNGKQLYNVTEDGTIVKFQPDGTPDNGYHSYAIDSPSEIPTSILRQMLADGKIGQHRYSQILHGNL